MMSRREGEDKMNVAAHDEHDVGGVQKDGNIYTAVTTFAENFKVAGE